MFKRFRPNRTNPILRELLQETTISKNDFIYPLFITEGKNIKNEVSSMPNVFQMSIDVVIDEINECKQLGLNSFILFGIPSTKDSIGSDALHDNGIIATSIREIKKYHKDVLIVTDLCFCEYTDHGHCGILDSCGHLDNDASLEILIEQALIHARNGADVIAPSGMLDGFVEVLRKALDENGFINIPIMSYSTKFASSYYGPFRDAACSTPSFGDRKSYQMNPANRFEAIRESIEDMKQGADILMVKPALAYLDIIREIKDATKMPLAIYNVSGEYSMVKLAGMSGVIDYEKVVMENMIAFKRAGADIIISYHSKDVCKILSRK
jgi:porphobilinogen synthase